MLDLSGNTNGQSLSLSGGGKLVIGDGGGTVVADRISGGAGSVNQVIFDNDTGDDSFSTVISGNIAVVHDGTNTTTLSGINTYTGGTVLHDRTLSVSRDKNLGDAAGTLTFNGGTLRTTATFSMNRATTINAGGGAFDVGTGTTLTQAGVIFGTGALTKQGAGTLVLSGANAYNGDTVIGSGVLSVSSDANLGNAVGTLTFNGGTLRTTADISMNRATTINAGGGTFDVDTGTTLTQAGAMSGAGILTKTGTGTLVLAGASTLSGANGTFVTGGGLVLDGGSLGLTDSFAQLVVSATGGGTADLTLQDGGTVSAGASSSQIYVGNNGGSGSLTITDSGSRLYANTTRIGIASTGTLSITGGGALSGQAVAIGGAGGNATATVSGAGSTLTAFSGADHGGGLGLLVGATGATGTLTIADSAVVTAGNTYLAAQGGHATLNLNGTSGSRGVLLTDSVEAGYANIFTAGATASLVFDGGILRANADTAGTNTFDFLKDFTTGKGTITINSGGAFLDTNGHTVSTAAIFGGAGGFTKEGTGTLILTGANTYTGGTIVEDGTLTAGATGAFVGNTAYTVNGGTLDLNGYRLTMSSLSGAGGTLVLGTAALTVNQATDTSFAGILSGTGAFTKSGTGKLTLTGASTLSGTASVTGGRLAFDGAAAGATSNIVYIGGVAHASLGISNGAALTTNSTVVIGNSSINTGGMSSSETGEATVAGVGSTWENKFLYVGYYGTGELNIEDHGQVIALYGYIGTQAGSTGTVDVTGIDALWRTTGGTLIGDSGTGTLNVSQGASAISYSATLGNSATGDGTANISGSGSLWQVTSGDLVVGNSGAGELNISDGAKTEVLNARTFIGNGSGSTGTVAVSGVGSTLTSKTDIRVGVSSTGTATVSAGGKAESAGIYLGFNPTGVGNLIVEGTNSSAVSTASLILGYGGRGTATVGDGGTLAVENTSGIWGTISVATLAGSQGTLNIGAAEGQAVAAAGQIMADKVQFGAGAGTVVFNHTGSAYDFSPAFAGSGSIRHLAGTSRFTGDSSAFAGTTSVLGGTLAVNGTLGGDVAARSGGVLTGSGRIMGSADLTGGGVLAGVSGHTLRVDGNVTMDATSALNASLGAASSTALVSVGGNLALNGTLNVTDAGGFGAGVYRLFDYSGSLSGSGLSIGTMPSGVGASNLSVQTAVANQVNLISTTSGTALGFWDGGNAALHDNGVVNGGAGVWSEGGRNWTQADGAVNGAFAPNPTFAVFQSAGGVVTVDGTAGAIGVTGMQFAADGYRVEGDSITLQGAGGTTTIRVGDGTAAGASMTATIASALTGTSTLVKSDLATLVLTGANSYTGGTQVAAGTLVGNAGSIRGDIANAGTVEFAQAGDASFAGNIAGLGGTNGAMVKSGAGNLVLTGTSSLDWMIKAGGLSTDASRFTSNAAIQSGANLTFDQSANAGYAGVIFGAGDFTKAGTGTLVLTGDNTYTGGTVIAAGALQLGGNGTTGSIVGDVIDNGALVFNRSDTVTFGGNISGRGTVRQSGSGTTILAGSNAYAGGTSLLGGVLSVSSDANLGIALSSLTFDGGMLQVTGTAFNGTARSIGWSANGGGFDIADPSNAFTLNQPLSGDGPLTKTGSGKLILAGSNNYMGDATIYAGTLQFGDGTWGSSNNFGGNLTVAGGALAIQTPATLNVAHHATFTDNTSFSIIATSSAPSLTAGSVTIGNGVVLSISGIDDASQTDKVLIDTRSGISGDFGTVTVGGGTGTVDYLTVSARKSADNLQYLASYGLSWMANNNRAHGTFTLANPSDTFTVGMALTDQAANATTGWDGTSLTKVGTGTLILSANNTYAGSTTIDGGTLQLGGGGTTGSIVGHVVNNGVLVFDRSDTLTFSSDISGRGAVEQSGHGTTILTGNNSYRGDTRINTGVLVVSQDANIGDPAGRLVFNGGTLATTAGFDTIRSILLTADGRFDVSGGITLGVRGQITGSGDAVKLGAGTLILMGANTYTGGTRTAAGTLIGNAASIRGSIANAGTVEFDQATNASFAGDIAGLGGTNGAMVKSGAGNLALTGATSLDWTIKAGGLSADASRFAGNASIQSGAHLIFDQSVDASYAGALSGTGDFTKSGTGMLTLSGESSAFAGNTVISAGALRVNGTLGGNVVVRAVLSGSGHIIGNVDLTGGGVIAGTSGQPLWVNGNVTMDASSTMNVAFGGAPSGSALFTVAGNLTLGGTWNVADGGGFGAGIYRLFTYGGTLIDNGLAFGTLPAGVTTSDLSVQTAVANQVNLISTAGSVLQFWDGSAPGNANNGVVNGGNGTWTAAGAAGTGPWTTADGAVNGGVKPQPGFLVFQGAPGTVTADASAGALVVTGLQFTVDGYRLQGAPVALAGAGGSTTIRVGDGTMAGAGFTVTIASALIGTSRLVKDDLGTLVLTGANSYSGGTLVAAGVLQGNSASLQGDIVNNATVVFDQSADGTYGGSLSGSGALTKTGAGMLILSGANGYAGGTTVAGGILQGNTASLQGAIVNNASVVFDQATGGAYAGAMSGAGRLTKTGAGNLTLSGSNSYTGGTTVSGGTLTGTTTSLQSAIANNATVVFDQGINGTYAGAMSGSGALVKSGAGTVTLTGANTYSGGTTVLAGALIGSSTSLQGNILNNAAVVFDQESAGTYAGNMTGTGSLTKSGAGVLSLTGTNVVGGGTTVSGGVLAVNGSLTSNVTVTTGGALGGSGSLIGALAINGGTLAPGNSIGTLNVTGNFSQTGGAYQVEANAQGQSDKIVASGTATIGGGATVQVLASSGTYQRNTTYTILTATGGLTGTYSGVTANLAFLTPSLSYDANNVYLLLAQTASAFASGAQTANQYAVGTALDIASPTATGDFNTVLNALAGLSTQQGPAALNTISGQPYAGFGSMNVLANQLFMNTLGQQIALARTGGPGAIRVALAEACQVACDTAEPPRWGAWFSGLGGAGGIGGNANAGSLTYNFGGAAVGVDYRLDPRFLVGLAFGYSSGRQWVSGFQGTGYTDTYSAALYASFNQGGFHVDALAGYAYGDNRQQRVMQIPGLATRYANGGVGTNQFLGQIEAGYKIGFGLSEAAQASVTPFARFQTVAASQRGFSEWGAQSLNLLVQQQNTTSVRTVLGADLAASLPLGSERSLGVTLRLGWAHDYADTTRPMTAAFAGAPALPFTVYGAQPMHDAAVIGLGLSTRITDTISVYARYDGELNGRDDNHTFSAGLRMTW